MNSHEAVLRFVGWMRDWGFAGWHTGEDLVEFYRWFCADERLEEMTGDHFRERVVAVPGVLRERRRLNVTSDPEMVRIRRRLKGATRAVLYRVGSLDEVRRARSVARADTRSARRPARAGHAATSDARLPAPTRVTARRPARAGHAATSSR